MNSKKLTEKLISIEAKIKKIENKTVIKEFNDNRKKRTRRLIRYGLLFEFANLNNIPLATVLGYLLDFQKHKDNRFYLDNLYLKGKTKFLEKNFNDNIEDWFLISLFCKKKCPRSKRPRTLLADLWNKFNYLEVVIRIPFIYLFVNIICFDFEKRKNIFSLLYKLIKTYKDL